MKDANEAVSRFLNREPEWTFDGGLLLNVLTAMFRASGKEEYRRAALAFLEKNVSAEGAILPTPANTLDLAACGMALFFALDETGEERYKKALDAVAGCIMERPLPNTPAGLYAVAPFLAEYDTRFGGKQAYKALAGQFKSVHQALFDQETGLYLSENRKFSLADEGFMLLSLADTAEKLDMQIYEHYRTLADLLLEAVRIPYRKGKDILHFFPQEENGEETLDLSGQAMMAAAMFKGVRLGILNEEKYLPLAMSGQGNLFALYAAGISCEPGPWMLLLAEAEEVERS